MRIIFFGNSDFSIRVLKKLMKFDLLVITSQDKPAGRNRVLKPNPVKAFCIQNNLNFLHDNSWDEVSQKILAFRPDFIVVASYGRIISKQVLDLVDIKRRLNIHPSLLPRWRGPAPIQWTILSGDKTTGVSICLVDEKVDRGDIIFQKEEKISDDDDFLTLGRLFDIGAEYLPETMENILRGKSSFIKQDESKATWARLIKKEDGFFSFKESAEMIHRKMRAFVVWPKIYTKIKNQRVIIHKTLISHEKYPNQKPGDIVKIDDKGIHVACNDGIIILSLLQKENKNVLNGKDFANGMRINVGDNILDYA